MMGISVLYVKLMPSLLHHDDDDDDGGDGDYDAWKTYQCLLKDFLYKSIDS